MPSLSVKDASATTQTIQTLPAVGQGAMAASLPVAEASDSPLVVRLGTPADAAWDGVAANPTKFAIDKLIALQGQSVLTNAPTTKVGVSVVNVNDAATVGCDGMNTVVFRFPAVISTGAGVFEATLDGTNWDAINVKPKGAGPAVAGVTTLTSAGAQTFEASNACYVSMRFRVTTAFNTGFTLLVSAGNALHLMRIEAPITDPVPSASIGAGNIATNQVTLGTTAALIVAARAGRQSCTIENTSTTPVYLGATGVTTTTGILLPGVVGASVTIPSSAAVYGIVASGTPAVCVLETY